MELLWFVLTLLAADTRPGLQHSSRRPNRRWTRA